MAQSGRHWNLLAFGVQEVWRKNIFFVYCAFLSSVHLHLYMPACAHATVAKLVSCGKYKLKSCDSVVILKDQNRCFSMIHTLH